MCFRKKNKVTKPVVKSELDEQLDKQLKDLHKTSEDVSLMFQHGVSRFDYTEAYLKALIQLHPEVREHPVVLDLLKKEEEYQKEKAKAN